MTELYAALLTAPASDTDTGSTIKEPETGAYERKKVNLTADPDSLEFITTAGPAWRNGADSTWKIVGAAIVDGKSGGAVKGVDTAMEAAEIKEGDTFKLTKITIRMGAVGV